MLLHTARCQECQLCRGGNKQASTENWPRQNRNACASELSRRPGELSVMWGQMHKGQMSGQRLHICLVKTKNLPEDLWPLTCIRERKFFQTRYKVWWYLPSLERPPQTSESQFSECWRAIRALFFPPVFVIFRSVLWPKLNVLISTS